LFAITNPSIQDVQFVLVEQLIQVIGQKEQILLKAYMFRGQEHWVDDVLEALLKNDV
jgi:hypothetical protein